VERYEAFTPDVQESLTTLMYQIRYNGIVLVTDGGQACLMQGEEVKRLLVKPPAALVLIRLPACSGSAPYLRARFISWLHRRWESLDGTFLPQAQVGEEPLRIRTKLPS
ncbi:MAG TPA: hypothetical protein VIY29_00330, partial [Ktedonobacteraceae bacterium]